MTFHTPYQDTSVNTIYNLLFCELDVFKATIAEPYSPPFDVLLSDASNVSELQKIIDDHSGDPRVRMLAYNKQRVGGHNPEEKELLGVIVEVGLEEGLDVLASFNNATARYLNHTGKLVVWENTDDVRINDITDSLFAHGRNIIGKIGPWTGQRKPNPPAGNTRITFLVSDGLYFGEATTEVLFSDRMAGPALLSATHLLQYLTDRSVGQNANQ
ncbi:MAG: hypothetical protein QM762_24330 [Chryseolinea sp.]